MISSRSVLKQILTNSATPHKIKFKNMEATSKLIDEFISGGSKSLQVIMDFDYTLTRRRLKNGEPCHSSQGILTFSPLMPESYGIVANSLYKKYYPIEIDHNQTIEEKIPHMVEWYTSFESNIVSSGLTRNLLEKIIKADQNVYLRDNVQETLALLNNLNIPTLIFSAGIGNLIEALLQLHNIHYPNIHIISNFLKFDVIPNKHENDQPVVGFHRPLIHVFNKNENAIPKDSTYFQDLSHRNNVILLGDTLTDITMSNGVHNPNIILKIGFLNDNFEERLDGFLDVYDIVLVDDQTMDFLNLFLKMLLKLKY